MTDDAHSYCDWLTLTTATHANSLEIRKLITAAWPAHTRTLARRMQFEGWTVGDGSIFFGSGDISGHIFYMIQVSGALAHKVLGMVAGAGVPMNCTRIDIQRTVAVNLGDHSVLDIAENTHHQNVDYYVNPGAGTWTINTGVRASRKYIRLYIKRLDRDYLRFEVELKRDYSRVVYDQILLGGQDVIDGLYVELVDKSKYPENIKSMFTIDANAIPLRTLLAEQELKNLEGYMQYLDNCHKSLESSLGDDTRAGPVRQWILRQARMLDRFP